MGKATYTVTVTNNSNGVSVDYETEAPMELLIPDVAADVVKDLVNTVRAYDTENERRRLRLVNVLTRQVRLPGLLHQCLIITWRTTV